MRKNKKKMILWRPSEGQKNFVNIKWIEEDNYRNIQVGKLYGARI